jgi:hypothetical protein
MRSTKEILENVVRLVSLINDGTLHEVEDLPMIELAKWVIFPRPESREQSSLPNNSVVASHHHRAKGAVSFNTVLTKIS